MLVKCHNTRKAPKIGAFNVFEKSLLYPEQEYNIVIQHIDILLFIKIADTTADTFLLNIRFLSFMIHYSSSLLFIMTNM